MGLLNKFEQSEADRRVFRKFGDGEVKMVRCLPAQKLQHIFFLLQSLRLIHVERGLTPPKKLVS